MVSTARSIAASATAAWAATLAVNRSLRRVRGHSMAPTLHDGDLVTVLPGWRVGRGDVVLVRDPRDTRRVTVKRVLALPGEQLEVLRGRALVDGVRLHEGVREGAGPDATLQVPAGHVAVLGDSRGRSTDSRVFGPVPLELVEGRVVARVTPSPTLLLGSSAPPSAGRTGTAAAR